MNSPVVRRQILTQLEPRVRMLRLEERGRQQRRWQFVNRHFTRGQAFVLGLAAGASVTVIVFTLAAAAIRH